MFQARSEWRRAESSPPADLVQTRGGRSGGQEALCNWTPAGSFLLGCLMETGPPLPRLSPQACGSGLSHRSYVLPQMRKTKCGRPSFRFNEQVSVLFMVTKRVTPLHIWLLQSVTWLLGWLLIWSRDPGLQILRCWTQMWQASRKAETSQIFPGATAELAPYWSPQVHSKLLKPSIASEASPDKIHTPEGVGASPQGWCRAPPLLSWRCLPSLQWHMET